MRAVVIRRLLSALFAILIIAGAAWYLAHAFGSIRPGDVERAFGAEPVRAVIAAIALTALSYVGFAGFDVFAARITAPNAVRPGIAALAGAASNAVAATLGFQAITATAVRLRLYRRVGLSIAAIAEISVLATLALASGFVVVLAMALVIAPEGGSPSLRLLGAGIVLVLGGLVACLPRDGRRVTIRRITLPVPGRLAVLGQFGLAAIEMLSTIGALYVLMPADLLPSFARFSAEIVGATLLGMGSQTPGGLGVFEASVVALVGGDGRADLLAALLLYRLINNLLPFLVSLVAVAWFELRTRRA